MVLFSDEVCSYLGIIDTLQPYNKKKKFETLFKSIGSPAEDISVVNPSFYAKRFYQFMVTLEVCHQHLMFCVGAKSVSGSPRMI